MSAVSLANRAHRIYTIRLIGRAIAKLLKNINRIIYCCGIPYQVDIPISTRLPHQGMGIVMHPKTVIGENCIIFQHVTIGSAHGEGSQDNVPIIRNNVIIGAGAALLGNITIGNNVTIGANAVVLDDMPDIAVAVGIPAVIKKYLKNEA